MTAFGESRRSDSDSRNIAAERPVETAAESGSSNRWRFSGTKDRYTSEAAIHILVAENSIRTSASPPKAAAEMIES